MMYLNTPAIFYGISPEKLGLDDIQNYQLYLIEQRQLSPESINTFVSAVKFLYTVTSEMPWSNPQFVRLKTPTKLPVVLSQAALWPHSDFNFRVSLIVHRLKT